MNEEMVDSSASQRRSILVDVIHRNILPQSSGLGVNNNIANKNVPLTVDASLVEWIVINLNTQCLTSCRLEKYIFELAAHCTFCSKSSLLCSCLERNLVSRMYMLTLAFAFGK